MGNLSPRIYNLHPLLAGTDRPAGASTCRGSRAMGFDWVYVNAFFAPARRAASTRSRDPFELHPLVRGEARERRGRADRAVRRGRAARAASR